VIDPDPLAVRVEEGLGDRQSQVGAGVGFAAKEEAEDLFSAVDSDTGVPIGDGR
jgi:hypothetical protein